MLVTATPGVKRNFPLVSSDANFIGAVLIVLVVVVFYISRSAPRHHKTDAFYYTIRDWNAERTF